MDLDLTTKGLIDSITSAHSGLHAGEVEDPDTGMVYKEMRKTIADDVKLVQRMPIRPDESSRPGSSVWRIILSESRRVQGYGKGDVSGWSEFCLWSFDVNEQGQVLKIQRCDLCSEDLQWVGESTGVTLALQPATVAEWLECRFCVALLPFRQLANTHQPATIQTFQDSADRSGLILD